MLGDDECAIGLGFDDRVADVVHAGNALPIDLAVSTGRLRPAFNDVAGDRARGEPVPIRIAPIKVMNHGRQGEGRVASPGTDVEDAFGAGGRRKIDNKLELVPGPVFAGGVSLRGLLPAARGACHRLSLRRRCRAPA